MKRMTIFFVAMVAMLFYGAELRSQTLNNSQVSVVETDQSDPTNWSLGKLLQRLINNINANRVDIETNGTTLAALQTSVDTLNTTLDSKLNKVYSTPTNKSAYTITKGTGTDIVQDITGIHFDVVSNTIPIRDVSGRISVATPYNPNEAANKIYVDNSISPLNTAISELKTTMNGNNYSTSEINTGNTWIDGKTIYKKTLNVGNLPNNTEKRVALGVVVDQVVKMEGMSYLGTGNAGFQPLPYVSISSPVVLGFGTADNAVVITTNTDQSARTGYVTVYYTIE
jgi:hypothetical protein